jgi:anti-sigma factor RsiW
MTCEECFALASDYIDDALNPLDAVRYRAHTAACTRCERYQVVLQQSLDLVREMPEIQPSSDFEWRLNRRLRELDEELAVHQNSVRSGVVVALGLAALVVFVAWAPIFAPDRGTPGRAVAYPTEAPAAENESLVQDVTGEWLLGRAPTRAFSPPSATNMFPGPYSPLLVAPPLGGGRTVLTSLVRPE